MYIKHVKQASQRAALLLAGVLLMATPVATAYPAGTNKLDQKFAAAAQEFGVPKELLMALSYNQSRWENHNGKPSASGGYGLTHLTTDTPGKDGRGDPDRPRAARSTRRTLDEAAALLQVSAETLKHDDQQNIRGAAALLARYARETNDGQLPRDMGDWSAAIAKMSNGTDAESVQDFADSVYKSIENGMSKTTESGERLNLQRRSVTANRERIAKLRLPSGERSQKETECPPTLVCKFVPARFAQNNPNDPTDYGNYDKADREKDLSIKYIVIHDTEGSYQSAIDWYKDPASYVSAHYTIRSSDGEVTQSVKTKDVAWHAGNWYMNMHSVGIEHEGFATEGATWYTEEMYRSSAKLVRYLADKYHIPLDREHIIGHEQYHGPRPGNTAGMHWDPGPYWDWDHYMDLLGAHNFHSGSWNSNAVTISPSFSANQPLLTECTDTGCVQLPAQPSNFIYLRTAPNESAPLLGDMGLHPDGSAGTTEISDWSAKAFHGQHFAVAERQGDWTAVWFGGQKGWFFNPSSWFAQTARPSDQKLVTPRDGVASIPVYGRPVPEASAFPVGGVPALAVVPLQYTIPAGQKYPVYDTKPKNDYFHVLAFDRSTPGDGDIVVGNEKYLAISYNHRQAFVKASDVKQLN